ncbi:Wzz/FepE/Etk N-terminal domain-containing protein [Bariatricus massiliensis]|uniref:Polysaccharide export protein n=1 Tax=Bariatricus massiliensis TaxID=1745713 RepID=A0ABS8DCW1_9FIRM|nr:Wzz/FepE/Etk N-terminal domain-containing protein [Bariatricus massiliensis]MCB7303448.1 polysaccharide export protein [Bariatricus massiliensis]MCB7373580.1 polysaccharide export protein [Bariatricus massiliensis]MCB7386250.1 polysaccharide export protein [Bariatricus massiliensis]MCB7410412.1 polysaccharide export protein [Bariatricus massiliensis]MCQ5252304.1 Wzz/FepE/Etk N-terminal domain-containing protein [Bariatricus massiliensis]
MDEIKQIEAKHDDEIEIDLGELFHLLLQKMWIIILCLIVGAALAFGGTKFVVTPQYSASSIIYILTKTTTVTSLADIQMGAQLTVDFEILAKSRTVVEEVIETLDLDTTYEELLGQITTENPTGTRMLELTVTDPDPEMAKTISNALADATADRVADVMNSDKPNIVDRAVKPAKPSSPSMIKNVAIGALAGAFLAIAVVVIRFLLNDTVQTEEDIRKYLNLNTLAAVPLEKRR